MVDRRHQGALGAGCLDDHVVLTRRSRTSAQAFTGRHLVGMAGRQIHLGAQVTGHSHRGQADGPSANHQDALARLHVGHVHGVHRHGDRLDQAGIADWHTAHQRDDACRVNQDPVGHTAIHGQAVERHGPALLLGASRTPVAGAAGQRGPDGNLRAVGEAAGHLVAERVGEAESGHVQVGAADAGRGHIDHHAVAGRIVHLDDPEPSVNRPYRAHGAPSSLSNAAGRCPLSVDQ